VLYLIIGVGTALAASWGPTLAGVGTSRADLFAILGASLVYMIVAWQIPSFASILIAGSVNLTLGTAVYTGGSMAAMALGVKGIAARAAAAEKQLLDAAYAHASGAATRFLNDHFKAHNPFLRMQERTVSVEVTSVLPLL
jgi:type IV secretory pathway TrbL component